MLLKPAFALVKRLKSAALRAGKRWISYKETVKTVNSLHHSQLEVNQSNVPEMTRWLKRIGYSVSDLSTLNILHVTGTKGKGSTCLYCEGILRHYGHKTGVYCSPHILSLTERFLFDGKPVAEDIFTKNFWDMYKRLLATKEFEDDMPQNIFQVLTVLAFHLFLQHGVNALVLEVGIGGEHDSTNVVEDPVVCGITTIHLDHIDRLGDTLQSIAWHKSGIFKPSAPGLTVPQHPEVMSVLKDRATERGTTLTLVPPLSIYETGNQPIKLGLVGEFQKDNAALAVHMCRVWLETLNRGLSTIRRTGRLQIVSRPGVTYYFDPSHTDASIQACVNWFLQETAKEKEGIKGQTAQVLLYYMHVRDLNKPLSALKNIPFDAAIFTPFVGVNEADVDTCFPQAPLEDQLGRALESKVVWDNLDITPCVSHTEDVTRKGKHCQVGKGNTRADNRELSSLKDDNPVHSTSRSLCGSFVVPYIHQALNVATQGRDPNIRGVDGSVSHTDYVPEMPESVRKADHVQVLIVGGHKIVGYGLWHLNVDC